MEEIKKVIIIPAKGMGPAICEIVWDNCDEYEMMGFLDDNVRMETRSDFHESVGSYTVIGTIAQFSQFSDCQFIIAGFANDKDIARVRRTYNMMTQRTSTVMGLPDDRFETVINWMASVSKHAEIGNGCVIMSGVRIAPGVKIGNHVMIMPNAVIEHNTVIGDFCNICAGAIISGYVTIGEACWIGANASVTSKVSIDDDCLVGIGAVVIRDIERNSVMVGNPARFLRRMI